MAKALLAAFLLLPTLLSAGEDFRLSFRAAYASPEALGVRSSFRSRLKRVLTADETPRRVFGQPMSAAAAEGEFFVADLKARCVWRVLRRYGVERLAPPGGFVSPVDLALSDSALFVSDSGSGTVWSWDRASGRWEPIPGSFRRPTGLAWIPGRETLLVADTEGHAILGWDGAVLNTVVGGGLNFPTDAAGYDADCFLVADAMDHEIEIHRWDGGEVRRFGKAGDAPGTFAFLRGVASDSRGRIFVSDVHQAWIQVFDGEGNLLGVFGGGGTLTHPSYLSFSNGTLWVADAFAGRVLELEAR